MLLLVSEINPDDGYGESVIAMMRRGALSTTTIIVGSRHPNGYYVNLFDTSFNPTTHGFVFLCLLLLPNASSTVSPLLLPLLASHVLYWCSCYCKLGVVNASASPALHPPAPSARPHGHPSIHPSSRSFLYTIRRTCSR
eukprot:GHVU01040180.1.p1 GENE.GHVU01040180.1~~GHVU01040180.1.p1  ORF type:complete len:139 (-),score=1.22 GHVU01040180.1:190-606(-)